MSSSTHSPQPATVEIRKEQWVPFLAEFTRENRGAHARLEVLGSDAGYNVETEDRPFDGISSDVKDKETVIWISFGSTREDHLTHGVHQAKAVRVRPPAAAQGAAVEVEAEDGTKTILQLSLPAEYALPPGQRQERQRNDPSR